MRKFLIVVFVLAMVSVGAGLYRYVMEQSDLASDPLDAIPATAAIIISYPDISEAWEAFEDLGYFDMLRPVGELQPFFTRNMLIDSLLSYDEDIRKMLSGSMLWSSYHLTGGDSLHVFHAIRPYGANEHRTLNMIKRVLNRQGVASEQMLGEVSVSKLVFTDPYNVLYYTVDHGLILVSSDLGLLRASLDQLRTGHSLRDDPYFMKASASAGSNVEADLYINYTYLPRYLARYMKPGVNSVPGVLGALASWTELDVHLKEDGLTFNGFTYSNDSLPEYLNLFLSQKPQTISFPQILPSNTASFVFFGIDDVISLASDYRKLLGEAGKLARGEAKLDSLNSYYGVDIEQSLLAWMGNEFGICITEPATAAFADRSYVIFKARSVRLADKLLNDLSNTLSEKKGGRPETVEVNGIRIHRLELSGILAELFGEGFERYESLYYMIVNDYVVFGTNRDALADFLRDVQSDRTLGKELAFSRFAENLSSTFNVFTYSHLARSQHVLESYLNRESLSGLERNRDVLRNFEAFGSQLTSTGESFYSNIFLRYNPDWQTDDRTHWEAEMSSAAQMPPVFVKNHLSGEWEVLVQDSSNSLYLFNRSGREIFRLVLPEPVLSRPVQIDAFRNGSLQYVFNTRNLIYLIDRSGNVVDGYPIKLDSPAETRLSVIEYDRKRDYRLLIACTNRRIYNYSIKGKKIKGWKHNKASDATVYPFLHLFSDGKDYLVTGESNGKIHLLDRRGKNRVKVAERILPSGKNTLQGFVSTEKAYTGIYVTDAAGRIHHVALNGSVKSVDVGRFSPGHRFLVADLNKDGSPEFIFSDLNLLQVFSYGKKKVFEQRLDPSASEPFLIDLGEDGLGIGFCFNDPEQLVLYGSKGEQVEGFPLSGTSEFDMAADGPDRLAVSATADSSLSIQSLH